MFLDFIGTLCKLSLEMVSMQSGVDVGAGAGTGEGALDVEEDNIPSASTSATSLITPRTEWLSRRRVSTGIHPHSADIGVLCPPAFVYPN